MMTVDFNTLESMCELVIDCPHSTPKWTETGVVVLRNQNIRNGTLSLSNPSFTTEEHYIKRTKRATPQAGDIVITREAPMGEVCIIPENLKCCLGQRQVLLRPKKNVNGLFLFWALQSPMVKQQISWNEGTGSTVSNIRIPVLKDLKIPRLSNEKKLASILNSLSKKIELNQQINQTLEAMAQALFKSWFVDFDPVKAKIAAREAWLDRHGSLAEPDSLFAVTYHDELNLAAMEAISGKNVEALAKLANSDPERYAELKATAAMFPDALVDSELGEIPAGWEVKSLAEVVEVIGGGTPKKSEPKFWDGDIRWFSVKDAPNDGDVFVVDTESKITKLGLLKSSTKLLEEGVTIITARGTVGKLALVGKDTTMNQSCYGIKAINGDGPYYNYFRLKQTVEDLKRNTHGAVFDTITKNTFECVFTFDSDIRVKASYEKYVSSMMLQIKNNLLANNSLSNLRDTLLPKLLSGELSVEGITLDDE